ncbi:MAG TPA: GMP synthase [Chitinophagales bacterium]|nr:GMP synthase [Chitinophagales bacterium]HRK27181.1 GMP synthase [Chitinophagales bacterium]
MYSPYARIAILDMYDGHANQGMRSIQEIIDNFAHYKDADIEVDVFDTRGGAEVPGLEYDAYISTGGPGSPIDSEGSLWEERYFGLLDSIMHHNLICPNDKKSVFLICHSFQLFCRYYGLAHVSLRKSTSFGVMPIHKTDEGLHEPLFANLDNPFWAVDSRDWQVTQPNLKRIEEMGGALLCIEKYRPHVPLERAVMAIRFNDAIIGTQFHPEADPEGFRYYLKIEEKRNLLIAQHGEKKYIDTITHLEDPDKIVLTHNTILPTFLEMAIGASSQVLLF